MIFVDNFFNSVPLIQDQIKFMPNIRRHILLIVFKGCHFCKS